MQVGSVVKYPPMWPSGQPDDSSYVLLDVEESMFSANATIRRLVTGEVQTVPLVVRYLHPGFMFQKVGFVPS